MPRTFMALLLGAGLVPSTAVADLRNFDDAALHAIQFIDKNEGWAVGDDGVVWHTIDGGRDWERQPTGARASLRALHFLNPYTGWIVGREELPNGYGSTGVVLFTQDGGLKWHKAGTGTFPGLNGVRFTDPKTGYVVGDGTNQFPCGVFITQDAGRSWKPVPGSRGTTWLAAGLRADQTGILAGAWGRLSTLRQSTLIPANIENLGGRAVRGVQLLGERAIAVGQGGLVLGCNDLAEARWSYADLKLSPELRASWDFHAVHATGSHVWVVGRPGSALLHSADMGATWQTRPTGLPLPLNGVFFIDEGRGWTVGELGTILATTDGGKTWGVQHQGGQRAAVLFIHARPTRVPVDTIARLGAEDGYLAAALRVTTSDPASAAPGRAVEAQRFAAAIRQAGGAAGEACWPFPMPQHLASADKSTLLRFWDQQHGEPAAEHLLRQLVLALRVWRPSVVVTDHPDARVTNSPADALLAEAVHEACARAADPSAFPEQLRELSVEPWEVLKLYALWETKTDSHVALDLTEVNAHLAATTRDFASEPAGLLAETAVVTPNQRFYRLLATRLEGAAGHQSLMQGIHLAPGGIARRRQAALVELSPEIDKAIRARRNLQALTEMPAPGLADPEKTLVVAGSTLATMPDDQAAPAAFAIANQYARQGHWTLAREMFLLMADRFPAHPLTADAYRWLIRHNGSSEARRRHELGQFLVMTESSVVANREGGNQGASLVAGPAELRQRHDLTTLGSKAETRRWYQGCLDVGSRLGAYGPLFANEPAVQFCLQAARRNLGEFEKTRQWYAQFLTEQPDGPWRDAATAELWLGNRAGPSGKPVAYCRQTATRPFLDGNFDDACWQGLKPLTLRPAAGNPLDEYATEAWLAYDKDFLYLALRCRHPADRHVPPVEVRPRDADVEPFDRVSLLLDLDRDYATCFHLQVDQRGCVREDCWGDLSWNPRWFVAVKSAPGSWCIESAIPMIELTGDIVTPGRAWACNLVRILPGRGVQAWSLPADVQPRPEGLGLLLFLPDESSRKAPFSADARR